MGQKQFSKSLCGLLKVLVVMTVVFTLYVMNFLSSRKYTKDPVISRDVLLDVYGSVYNCDSSQDLQSQSKSNRTVNLSHGVLTEICPDPTCKKGNE